jgi:hypothetical protein
MRKYNLSSYFVWVWNLVSHTKGGAKIRVSEKNICTKEGGSGGRLEKTTYEELHNLYSSIYIIRVDEIKQDEMGGT